MKMKLLKVLTTMLLFVGFMTAANSQIGLKVAANYSTVYGESEQIDGEDLESIGFGPGFSAGVFFRAGESLVSFQGELLYEMRTSKSFKEYAAGSIDVETNNRYSFINLPLLAVFNFGNFKPYAGVNVGYLIGAKGEVTGDFGPPIGEEEIELDYFDSNDDTNDPRYDYSEDGYFNRLNIGANIGMMFQLSEAFHLDLRVEHGITDLTNNDKDLSFIPPRDSREDTDRTVNISLGAGLSI